MVTVDVPHGKYKIKMIHQSGFLSCYWRYNPSEKSNFGCIIEGRVNVILIIVTDSQNNILLPKQNGYSHDGNISNSKYLIFNDVIELKPGQQLRFWYKEDLETVSSESDNAGVSKFYAYAMLHQKISHVSLHKQEL